MVIQAYYTVKDLCVYLIHNTNKSIHKCNILESVNLNPLQIALRFKSVLYYY